MCEDSRKEAQNSLGGLQNIIIDNETVKKIGSGNTAKNVLFVRF
jgi:hypothetical protein